MTPSRTSVFFEKVKSLTDMCRISNIEKMLSNALESMPTESVVDYVGELNKNDIMG